MLYLKWGVLGQEGHFMEKSSRASRRGDFKENPCAKLFWFNEGGFGFLLSFQGWQELERLIAQGNTAHLTLVLEVSGHLVSLLFRALPTVICCLESGRCIGVQSVIIMSNKKTRGKRTRRGLSDHSPSSDICWKVTWGHFIPRVSGGERWKKFSFYFGGGYRRLSLGPPYTSQPAALPPSSLPSPLFILEQGLSKSLRQPLNSVVQEGLEFGSLLLQPFPSFLLLPPASFFELAVCVRSQEWPSLVCMVLRIELRALC